MTELTASAASLDMPPAEAPLSDEEIVRVADLATALDPHCANPIRAGIVACGFHLVARATELAKLMAPDRLAYVTTWITLAALVQTRDMMSEQIGPEAGDAFERELSGLLHRHFPRIMAGEVPKSPALS